MHNLVKIMQIYKKEGSPLSKNRLKIPWKCLHSEHDSARWGGNKWKHVKINEILLK